MCWSCSSALLNTSPTSPRRLVARLSPPDPRHQRRFHGSAILSKLPIIGGGAFNEAGSPMTRADIATDAGTIMLINVIRWRRSTNHRRVAGALNSICLPSCRVRGGPADHGGGLRRDQGPHADAGAAVQRYRDAYSDVAGGIGPPGRDGMARVFRHRLDHVLVNDAVTVLRAEVQDDRGSDHRRLAVDLALTLPVSAAQRPAAPTTALSTSPTPG